MQLNIIKDPDAFDKLTDRFGASAALMLTSATANTDGFDSTLRDLNTYQRVSVKALNGIITIGDNQ